jgi:hypothetical protein
VPVDQTLNVDLMFVDGHAFLISVGIPIALTLCNDLGRRAGGRSKGPIRKALFNQLAVYTAHGYRITTLLTDGEGAIASLAPEIQGRSIAVNPAGPGQHVPVVERKIREVKERARTLIAVTPWKIPSRLRAALVCYCFSRINLVPHRGGLDKVSPREALLGIKADYNKDTRCCFGDYCECTSPVSDNTMRARTHPCVALYPTGTQGSWRFYSLDTGKLVTRDAFKVIPTPDWVIAHMVALAKHDSGAPIEAMEFTRGTSAIGDNDASAGVRHRGGATATPRR